MIASHGRSRRGSAFTLVELLVVVGISTVLIGLLLPAISRARDSSATAVCLSNLRQMSVAATQYATLFGGRYPIAQYSVSQPPLVSSFSWDYTTVTNTATGARSVHPGVLWTDPTNLRVQQCPAYDGRSATAGDPFTGYNYNTSYIGGGQNEPTFGKTTPPAKVVQVRNPSRTVLFGDAGVSQLGANKFMRSPLRSPTDPLSFSAAARANGAQGFRHNASPGRAGVTNVVFCDGHAESLRDRFTASLPVTATAGFISEDNSPYDLN
jgi:prepilin-type processing-associated H-X9-DG protein